MPETKNPFPPSLKGMFAFFDGAGWDVDEEWAHNGDLILKFRDEDGNVIFMITVPACYADVEYVDESLEVDEVPVPEASPELDRRVPRY